MTAPITRRFDRIVSPSSDSARYSIRQAGIAKGQPVREVHWRLPANFPLDQGAEGACVGFGTSAELAAEPVVIPATGRSAQLLYEAARREDAKMNGGVELDGEGASVLGGLRAARANGSIQGFAWAQSSRQLRDAVLVHGSVILGTEWTEGMDQLDADAVARAVGKSRGGHCWTVVGYYPQFRGRGEFYEAINSWGPGYGDRGMFRISRTHLDKLVFRMNGEAAIVTDRPVTPAAA